MNEYHAWAGRTSSILELGSRVGERLALTDGVGIEIDRNSSGISSHQGHGSEELHYGGGTRWLVGGLAWQLG
jgi:hypothetical protein